MSTTIITSAILSGGTVFNTNIPSGGFEIALSGTLANATIAAGGTLLALPGVTISGLSNQGTLLSGGIIEIATSSIAPGTLAVDIISATLGPVLLGTLNIDGTQLGFEQLIPAPPGEVPIFQITGVEPTTYIGTGGTAATVNSDGVIIVSDGGQISNVADYAVGSSVTEGRTYRVDAYTSGIAYNSFLTPLIGNLTVGPGGLASAVNVSGGILNIASGGLAQNISATGFVYQWVDVEGYTDPVNGVSPVISTNSASNITGQINVLSGATVSAAIINSLGAITVAGSALATTVNSGGAVTILAGGATSASQINGAYNNEDVENVYGTTSDTALNNSATENVYSGGLAISTSVGNGSEIDVRGGAILSAQLGAGQIYVSAGIASGTDILGYGQQSVYSGGTAINTNIGSGTEVVDGGTVSGATTNHGTESVNSGGATYDDIISGAYSVENIYSGAAISSQIRAGAGLDNYGGTDIDTVVSAGGYDSEYNQNGTTKAIGSATTILSAGKANVFGKQAILTDAIISSGGFVGASLSGTVENTTIGNGATVYLTQAAQGDDLNVTSGGTVIVDTSAGTAYVSGITVQSGGVLELTNATQFATTSGTILSGGIVALGGVTISGATVSASPVTAPLTSGGLALQTGAVLGLNGAVVESGGELIVTSGATVLNTDNEYGGTLAINAGATAIDLSINRNTIIDNGLLEFTPLADSGDNQLHPQNNNLGGDLTGTGSLLITGPYTIAEEGVDNLTGGTTIGPNATLDVVFSASEGAGAVSFGQNAELDIGYEINNSTFNNALENLTPGDSIFFTGVGNAGTPYFTLAGDLLTLSDGNLTESVILGASSLENSFSLVKSTSVLGYGVEVEPLQVTSAVIIPTGGITTDPIITGGTLELSAGSTVAGNISFSGPGGRLIIDGPVPTNTITGFLPGDSIKLAGVPFNPADTVEVLNAGTITIDESGTLYELNIAGAYVGETGFSISGDLLLTEQALCYLRGTRILTPTGERPIEELRIGDLVVTRFSGIQPIKWIGRQNYDPRFLANNPAKIPVHIQAGALAAGMPARNLRVSPGHSFLLGEILVLASTLVNGITITQPAPESEVNYLQLELAAHDCIIAEGCWAETYADAPGQRAQFHNAAEYDALYPNEPPAESLKLCAPRPDSGRALEDALRPITARAGAGITPGPLEGFIDIASLWRIEGWALDPSHPNLPVQLSIWLGDEHLGDTLACHHREDLAAAGKGAGNCAFTFITPRRLSDLTHLRVLRSTDAALLHFSQPERKQAALF